MELIQKTKEAAEEDARNQPKAYSRADVPWSVEAITIEWLNDCLAEEHGKITDFALGPGSAGTSVRGKITAKRESKSDLHLFAKTYPTFEHRIANVLTETAQAEGQFYLEARPELQIETPKGFYWAYDENKLRAIVVIEDVSATKDTTFCDWRSSISRNEMEDAVRLLASVHSHFFKQGDLSKQFPWTKTFEQWTEAFQALRAEHLNAIQVARDVIPTSLYDKGEEIYDAFMQLRVGSGSLPSTLIHSDVHLGNWYKTGDGRMGLCDWQCCNRGPHIRDFSYAVSTMLEPEDRRSWEIDLIEIYLSELERLTGKKFDLESNLNEYRRYLLAALMMWTPTLCPGENFPDMQPKDMSRKMIERTTIAIDDHESLSLFDAK